MALTRTTAFERDAIGRAAAARELDTGDLLMLATAAVALLAVGLAYTGRRQSFELAEARRADAAAVVDLNTLAVAAPLERALRPALMDGADRAFAAGHLLAFLGVRREGGGTLPNVGSILSASVAVEAIDRTPGLSAYTDRLREARARAAASGREAPRTLPLLTTGDLAAVKPLLAVRSVDSLRTTLRTSLLMYVGGFLLLAILWRTRAVRGDRVLLGTAFALTAVGFALLVSRQDPVRDALLFVRYVDAILVGLATMAAAAIVNARRPVLRGLGYVPLAGALLLSALLILFGDGPGTSSAKVNLGAVQPIEAIRLLLALFLAGYFARRWELLRDVRSRSIRSARVPAWLDLPRAEAALPVVVGVGAAMAFFFLQRDLGPALLLACCFLAMYAVARSRVTLAAAGLATLAAGFSIGVRLQLSDTLVARVRMWQSPWDNAVRGGDQVAHAMWALATGGPIGTGLGLGDTRHLPAGHTDLVLAAAGEELGAVGVAAIAAAFALLAWRGLRIARTATSDYDCFLATSLTLFLVIPALVMGAGVLGLVPLTGVVTPFLSYGGSAMTANLAALGMLSVIRTHPHPPPDLEPFHAPIRWLTRGLAACAVCIAAAFGIVQTVRADEYAARPHLTLQADGVRRYQYNPRLMEVLRQIPRGTVYDRRGLPLATDSRDVLQRAAREYAKFGVSVGAACRNASERCYPLAGRTFHLLGDARSRQNWSASNTSYIERDAEDRLRGFDDHATAVQAMDGAPLASMVRRDLRELLPLLRNRYDPNDSAVREFMARPRDLRLTIDARLQARVADILAGAAQRAGAAGAAAVVLDADSGDVLAAASYPWPAADRDNDGANRPEVFLDRARYGLYPPGSTFKLLTAAAALRRDPALAAARFSCSRLPDGRVGARIPGRSRPIRDDVLDTQPHGTIDMHDGLVRSCNAYFAQLAVRLGPDALLEVAAPAGIPLAPANSRARLRDTLPQAGYGQGDVLTTPLRMARVAAAFAADGIVRDAGAVASRPHSTERLLAPASARTIARYLRDAVLEGTGRNLREHPGRIAGKTGTAEVAGSPSHAWFVGFAPYGRATRRIAFAVLIEKAGYGGRIAAPVAGSIVTAAADAGLIQ